MNSQADYSSPLSPMAALNNEQCLYDHLLACVRVETPEELLARFRALFIQATGYSEQRVWWVMERIIGSPRIDTDFTFILNRCCHILINHWLMQPKLHWFIAELVGLIDSVPDSPGHSRTTKRVRHLVRQFQHTEQHAALKRLAQVVSYSPEGATYHGSRPLGSLICRYPCLYEHSLLTEDSTDEERKRIRRIRRQAQRQFEQDLVRYTTRKLQYGGTLDMTAGLTGRSPKNPTLLSDRRLDAALQQFGGKVEGANTYYDLAQCFLTYSRYTPCYQHFKADLYEYLTAAIDSKYGKQQFNQRLYDYLQATLPDHNDEQLNDVLLVGTCRKLLNFLVVDGQHKPHHAVFVDLLGNLGTTMTIGLLLKVVLICRTVKPYLEKQFTTLFKHYESCSKDGVLWLVESLEHLNVAFSINFGALTLSSASL